MAVFILYLKMYCQEGMTLKVQKNEMLVSKILYVNDTHNVTNTFGYSKYGKWYEKEMLQNRVPF